MTGLAPLPRPTTASSLTGLTANSLNQLLNPNPNHTLQYYRDGNLKADGPLDANGKPTVTGTHLYTYDAGGSGRMLSAETKGGASASYTYDPFGRRIAKTVGGVTTQFLFDDTGAEIGEYDGAGRLLRRLLRHPDFEAPVAFADASGALSFTVTDRLGSVVATISSAGTVSNTYGYLPYGDTPSGTLSGTAFGYAGYRFDAETGTYHTATRSYDPRLGRFLQPDPLGKAAGRNVYAYVGSDPVNGTDPSGLSWLSDAGDAIGNAVSAIGNAIGSLFGGSGCGSNCQRGQSIGTTVGGIGGAALGGAAAGGITVISGGAGALGIPAEVGAGFGGGAIAGRAVGGAIGGLFDQHTDPTFSGPLNNDQASVDPSQDQQAGPGDVSSGGTADPTPPHTSVTRRPSGFRKGTAQGAWDSAQDGPNGGKLCPTCDREVTGNPADGGRAGRWDVDHEPQWQDRGLDGLDGLDRRGVLDNYNRGTRLRCVGCNRSDN